MHVSAESSLEVPRADPLRAHAEPWSLQGSSRHAATVNVSPWEVEPPSLVLHLPEVTVHLPTIVVDVLVVLRPGEKPRAQVRIDWGEPRVEVVPGAATVTPVRVRAVPETEQVRPLSVTVDLDGVRWEARAEAIDVRLSGAVEKR